MMAKSIVCKKKSANHPAQLLFFHNCNGHSHGPLQLAFIFKKSIPVLKTVVCGIPFLVVNTTCLKQILISVVLPNTSVDNNVTFAHVAQLGQISHVALWVTLATVTKKLRWMKLQTYKITFWQRLLARLSKKNGQRMFDDVFIYY